METKKELEKKLSPVNVWALAFGCIIGFGAFVLPGNSFLLKAGPGGTAIAILIAAVIMIFIAFNYHFMIAEFPLAGGEFTYTSNAFGNTHAFICAWFLGLSYATLVPMNATALALIGRNLLGSLFQFGFHYTVAGYDVYLGEILLALFAISIFAFLSIRGVKFAGSFQVILTFSLIIGVFLIVVSAILSTKASLHNLVPLFSSGNSKISGILAVMAVAPFLFVGFDTVPQSAEEFNFSNKKTIGIMIVSILFGGAVYIALNTITAVVIPDGYSTWEEYITASKSLNGIESLPTFYAAKELMGTCGLVFIGIAVLGATLSGIVGFYMATSRLLFSMAREKTIPAWFGNLHSKYNTPSNAILFVFGLSIIAPFFGRTVLGWLVDMSSLGAAIGYGYTSAATFIYAKKRNSIFYMISGTIGVVLSIIFAILLLVPIPGLGCSLGKESYICLILWIALGIWFKISSSRNK